MDPDEACDGSDLAGLTCADLGYEIGQLRCDERCALDPSGCGPEPGCGNGIIEPGEECEGNDLGGLGCMDLGHAAGGLTCGPDCRLDESGCHTCGNELVEANETCDGSDLRGAACADVGLYEGLPVCSPGCREVSYADCRFFCGDGERNGPESCDGSDLAGATCASLGYAPGGEVSCRPDCTLDVTRCCGDGTRVPEELCDGIDLGGMSCAELGMGFVGGQLGCDATCQYDVTGCHHCGDGHCATDESASSCPVDCGVVRLFNRHDRAGAVLADQTIRCWGRFGSEQDMIDVGDPDLGTCYLPVTEPRAAYQPADGVALQSVALGEWFTCVLVADGTVRCGGYYADGSLRLQAVEGLTNVVEIGAGYDHTCALRSDGTVWCWGENHTLQLGRDDVTYSGVPLQVDGIVGAVALSVTDYTSGVLLDTGEVQCWGWNDGLLGDGTTAAQASPVTVPGLSGVVSLSLGSAHGCAALDDGSAWCWGSGYDHELGDGLSHAPPMGPVRVTVVAEPVVAVSAGENYACALDPLGVVRCWGSPASYKLGTGATWHLSEEATPVNDLPPAREVVAGQQETCALLVDDTVRCWGDNTYGQLGHGGTIDSGRPVPVSGISDVVSVSAMDARTCAVTGAGEVFCGWASTAPVSLPEAATSISLGYGFYCALLASDAVWCRGVNNRGQLGQGDQVARSGPVQVPDLPAPVIIEAGESHVCAVLADGTARCWGDNTYGQLGNGSQETLDATPSMVVGLDDVVALSGGVRHSCAVRGTGTVHCWGDNQKGALGDGTNISSRVPVEVPGITDAVAVVVAFDWWDYAPWSCALHADGGVSCWGVRRLICPSDHASNVPVRLQGIDDVAALGQFASGHLCAIRGDGTAACWGACSRFQLGLGCCLLGCVREIADLAGVVSIAGGLEHTCAALDDGTVWCWGENGDGRLGNGQASSSPVPVEPTGL